MIRIKISRDGLTGPQRILEMEIVNDKQGTEALGAYDVTVEDQQRRMYHLRVREFRRERGAVQLVRLALRQYHQLLEERNHG